METPSTTTRRVTRSQTLSALKNSAPNPLFSKESEKLESKARQRNMAKPQQERSALFDITNDSPIIGLAMGKTPRNMSRIKKGTPSPGSGEALLRGQVKNLLQKVEEEAEPTKISVQSRPFIHLVTSPMALLAPTPANTPQVVSLSDQAKVVITSPVVAGQLKPASSPQVQVEESKLFESLELEKSPSITRSLMLDFTSDCSSVVTHNTEDDDNSSVWSMQVNTSPKDDDDDEASYSYIEEEEEEEGGIVDELCEGMRKMNFAGKHTRFLYDSDDEEIVEAREQSPGVLRLKGFPTPTGKHVRFD